MILTIVKKVRPHALLFVLDKTEVLERSGSMEEGCLVLRPFNTHKPIRTPISSNSFCWVSDYKDIIN